MDRKEQEFLKRLRETFRFEAEEHLRSLSTHFIELEKISDAQLAAETVEILFREAHSLKGAARSVNLKEVETLCQPLESMLAALKRDEISLNAPLFDLFHQAVDSLSHIIATMEAERNPSERLQQRELSLRLTEAAQGASFPAGAADANSVSKTPVTPVESQAVQSTESSTLDKPAEPLPNPETPGLPAAPNRKSQKEGLSGQRQDAEPLLSSAKTVRIPINKLDPLLLQAEGMIQAKLAGSQHAVELREIQEAFASWKTEWAKWKVEHTSLSNKLPEWMTARFETLAGQIASASQAFERDQRSLRHMIDDHLVAMKQVLMLPASILVEIFPRFVRDLGRDQGKEIDLTLRGADIEIDKRILEELKDPLIHLVRNCIDHGIERPEVRLRKGKTRRGMITLTFSAKDSRQVEILVSDDGAGIDPEQVRAAAIKAGSLPEGTSEKLKPEETFALIFQSGLSTSEIITDISGRGLGLAIVREKVENLGGLVSVESQVGIGTTFHLLLPLTLANFRGVLVSAREQLFVLPTTSIERVTRVSPEEIRMVENHETIQVDGDVLALVKLADVLQLPQRSKVTARDSHSRARVADTNPVPVLILASAEKRIAVQVDELLAEEEVLVKGLGSQLRRARNIAGATILGAGRVAPVLNISDLMSSALHPGVAASAVVDSEMNPNIGGRILVAEDSITSRTLLKNILETSGYQVTTAVDGTDAFTQLRSAEFDLVVSDVDMPRMSGFELTTRIRADKELAELPVVLVTALESRQDRERGIDVGANAYIIKSSFDQSNLLDVIRRLL